MPAVTTSIPVDARPALAHVNLMVDTFISNSSVEDLRSIVRSMLATGTPNLAASFTAAARTRLRQTNGKPVPNARVLFTRHPSHISPSPQLHETLMRARSLYGAGLGFASLGVLTTIVKASIGLRWEEEGDMADILAEIDADIGQAIQSSKEEIEGGRVNDFTSARDVVTDLRLAINESYSDVQSWGGEFPFERAFCSLDCWKI
ncbi:hypothetical protein BDN72DRAFT_861066 [Pluteus cervinus]|uniref:Uncharacterized protein n=1 Tax=Pluteus cervinus TaxID=181527 RepID=A0ACD3AG40_9AGAR|nr:hypothetical protein BDN72DRAFT_861066 [Pluteus cervinus]